MAAYNFPTLSAEQMTGVATTFQESFFHTLGAYTNSEHLPKIIEYVATLASVYQPIRAANDDGRQRLALEVFGNAALADFFMRLTTVFYSRMGSNDEVNALHGNLARGASLYQPGQTKQMSPGDTIQYDLVPKEIAQRTTSADNLIQILGQNGWMVSVLLVCLYLTPSQLTARK